MTGRARILFAAIAVALVVAMGSLGLLLWQHGRVATVAGTPVRGQIGLGALGLDVELQRLIAAAEIARQNGERDAAPLRERYEKLADRMRGLREEPFASAYADNRAYRELLERAEPVMQRIEAALAPPAADEIPPEPPGQSVARAVLEAAPALRAPIDGLLAASVDLLLAQGEARRTAIEYLGSLANTAFVSACLLVLLFAGIAVLELMQAQRAIREREKLAETIAAQKAEAEMADRAKSELLATVSHELRTPLQGMMGMVDLLAESRTLDETERDYARTVRQCAGDLMVLANDLVDLSQLRAGKLKLAPADANVEELVLQVAALLQPRAAERRNRLLVEMAPEMPLWWHVDPARLRQILFNLIGNAVKFTEGGTVWVAASHRLNAASKAELLLTVADTGAGIAPEGLATLFRRFDPASRSSQNGGAGLGLSITRELVELMGGTIRVDSALGRGTTVEVAIPLSVSTPPATLAGQSEAPLIVPEPGRYRVLAVDDVPVNRRLLSVILERAGHVCEEAASGPAAIEAVQRTLYDAVLMDVQMPGMDGMEATRRIRALPPPAGLVPVIAVTANVMPEQRAAYLASGMNDHVTKPVQAPDLLAALDRAKYGTSGAPARGSNAQGSNTQGSNAQGSNAQGSTGQRPAGAGVSATPPASPLAAPQPGTPGNPQGGQPAATPAAMGVPADPLGFRRAALAPSGEALSAPPPALLPGQPSDADAARAAAQAAALAQPGAPLPEPSAAWPAPRGTPLAVLDGGQLARLRARLSNAELQRVFTAVDADASRLAGEILAAVQGQDVARLRQVAQEIRIAFAPIGAPRLLAVAGTVETIADPAAALRLAPALAQTLVAARAAARRSAGLVAQGGTTI